MEIGKKIRELRIARNLTQEALAAELSVTPQAKMDNRYDKNINYHGAEGMLEILILTCACGARCAGRTNRRQAAIPGQKKKPELKCWAAGVQFPGGHAKL